MPSLLSERRRVAVAQVGCFEAVKAAPSIAERMPSSTSSSPSPHGPQFLERSASSLSKVSYFGLDPCTFYAANRSGCIWWNNQRTQRLAMAAMVRLAGLPRRRSWPASFVQRSSYRIKR